MVDLVDRTVMVDLDHMEDGDLEDGDMAEDMAEDIGDHGEDAVVDGGNYYWS
jgi:hypothetical protein